MCRVREQPQSLRRWTTVELCVCLCVCVCVCRVDVLRSDVPEFSKRLFSILNLNSAILQ